MYLILGARNASALLLETNVIGWAFISLAKLNYKIVIMNEWTVVGTGNVLFVWKSPKAHTHFYKPRIHNSLYPMHCTRSKSK